MITSYALAFGGLLLVGGRLSDLIGRKRALLIGLTGFAAASALGGAAPNAAVLLLARTLQGAFGALLTPSALALLATTFTAPAERGRAFGIYGTVVGSGSGIGVMLGGLLTDGLGWRWVMYVNLPIALVAGVGVFSAVRPVPRQRGRIDLVGATLATAGLVALVFGFDRAEADGWNSARTLGSLAAGVVFLALFVLVERRVDGPLLPLRVVLDPRRGAAYLAALSWGIGVIAAFFFLSFYLQTVLGYSTLRTGLAFLPYTAAIMVTVRVVRRFVGTVPVQRLLTPGLLAIAAGLALIGLLPDDGYYGTRVLPIFLLLGIGTGLTLITANSTATLNTGPDTEVAGAMVMTGQQIGGSLGTAVLGTLAATATADYLRDHAGAAGVAAVHGYNFAGFIGAAVLCVMAAVVFVVAGSRRSTG